jgi:predicted nucleic acid-binding protein
MRLFLDANVLFTAAHNPDGKSAFIIQLSSGANWETVTCSLAVEEARRNLDAKFPRCVASLESLMKQVGLVPTVVHGECPVDLPPKDRPILLSALGARCTHLLTGDLKDFRRFMNRPRKTAGLVIQTVGEFLDSL